MPHHLGDTALPRCSATWEHWGFSSSRFSIALPCQHLEVLTSYGNSRCQPSRSVVRVCVSCNSRIGNRSIPHVQNRTKSRIDLPAQQVRTSEAGCHSWLFSQMGHRRYCRIYGGTVPIANKRTFRGGRCFELQRRKISDGGDSLPWCALRIHRNHRRLLWSPFYPCSAPSGPVLGLAAAVRGGHPQPVHGWNCAQQTTDGYNKCVKLASKVKPSSNLPSSMRSRAFGQLHSHDRQLRLIRGVGVRRFSLEGSL
jgi:hypothetical protein